ncbi:hypothetical protein KAJ02_07870, partial [Candidatus Bipolaricaulota bacterium]|nr:hypothetical protein [Candidatus Bipolaricaulota bacterium]
MVSRYALAYPHIAFTLKFEGKARIQTSGNGNRLEVLGSVLGLDIAKEMIAIPETEGSRISISGFISSPSVHRGSRREITLFIQGRWVQDASLSAAVVQAYHGLLMVGRYPLAVLFIKLPPELVDVNVHPAKSEVRFQDPGTVFTVVQRVIRGVLLGQAPPPQLELETTWESFERPRTPVIVDPHWEIAHHESNEQSEGIVQKKLDRIQVPLLRSVGQVGASYLVAEGPDGLYLIDQHAAHERILFEAMMRTWGEQLVESQALLEPVTLSFSHSESLLVEQQIELLKALGFDTPRLRRYFSDEISPVTAAQLERYVGHLVADDVDTGGEEPLLLAGQTLQEEHLPVLEKAKLKSIRIVNRHIQHSLEEDQTTTQEEALRAVYRRLRPSDRSSPAQMGEYIEHLYFHPTSYHLSEVGRFKVNRKLGLQLKEPALYLADIVRTIRLLLQVPEDRTILDEKDHLANKRVRLPGELAENAIRTGMVRMARIARDKLSKYALEEKDTIRRIISTRTVQGAINQLFYTGRFSQFLEQTNPLTELTHKRRLNALGGGLTKRRAKIEVRDVHSSHYARICPIETPEGQNIGLITSLACYAGVNEFGFLVAPYRKVVKGKATDHIDYLMADDEEHLKLAPATTPMDKNGKLLGERIEVRTGREEVFLVPPKEVDYVGISPQALVGISSALIPFLEHDDA